MLTLEILPGTDPAGDIFPPEIRNAPWVGYHGTSSAYSARIESEGLRLEKPLPPGEIAFVADLARRFPEAGADFDSVNQFLGLGTISLTSDHSVTLRYLLPERLGGQGVGFVLKAAETLLGAQGVGIVPADRARLEAVAARVRDIRCHPPVIYAVNVEGLERVNYDKNTAGLYAHQWIPPDRILAKAVISKGVAIDPNAGSTVKVREFRAQAGSWLSRVPNESPIRRPWDVVPTVGMCPWRITAEKPDPVRFVELTTAAFAPRAWSALDGAEKSAADKSFVCELGRAYEHVLGEQGVDVAKRLAQACLAAFLGRESGRVRFHLAADDAELLVAIRGLEQREVLRAMPEEQARQFVQAARQALPGASGLFEVSP